MRLPVTVLVYFAALGAYAQTSPTGPAPAVPSPDAAEAPKQIVAVYAEYDRLGAAGDLKPWPRWYREHTTANYTERNWGGKVSTRKQLLEVLAFGAGMPPPPSSMHITAQTTLDRLTVKADTATAYTTCRSGVTYGSAPVHTLATTETYRDVWSKVGERWLLKRREVLTHRTLVDGKPYRSPLAHDAK